MRSQTQSILSLLLLSLLCVAPYRTYAQVVPSPATGRSVILTREKAAALMPATVFFRGRIAPIQARNSAGLRLPGDQLVLVAVVDTAGYSSAIQESYQAYLLTEVPLRIAGQTLSPGSYGIGFIAGDKFLVLNLGGQPILNAPSVHDAALARPNPLQLLPDPASPQLFRLYSGRNYVVLTPAPAAP